MTTVPDDVGDEEELARRCEKSKVKSGRVRWQAFMRTTKPLEISHDRAGYCDPWAAIADEPHRTLVFLSAGAVRQAISAVRVIPDKPPEEHALVAVHMDGLQDTSVGTREELEHLVDFNEFVAIAKALASLARAA